MMCRYRFQGMPGMMPMMKRAAFTDVKSGMPVYSAGTGANAYQHLIAMQPSGYGPITREYPTSVPLASGVVTAELTLTG